MADVSLAQKAQACRQALEELLLFAEERISPRVAKAGDPDERRLVLLSLDGSARSLVVALVDSRWPETFRAGTVIVRSLFEHMVDFFVIFDDAGGDLARRFLAFDEIQAWNYYKNASVPMVSSASSRLTRTFRTRSARRG